MRARSSQPHIESFYTKCYHIKAAVSWKFGHCYFLLDFFDVPFINNLLIINYFGNTFFSNLEKTEGKQLFEPLTLSVFTTVDSRLKSEQKEK